MYTYSILPDAFQEMLDAWQWYEEIQAGLGDRFREAVGNCIQYILENPYYFEEKAKNYREAKTPVFPFLIVYVVNEEMKHVYITALFHSSRNPKFKFRK